MKPSNFNSLRFRLPFSYAGIALIATLVLGAVLLLTLQRYYRQQELDYLSGNAQVIGDRLAVLLQSGETADLPATLKGVSFLSQTRVQLWSPAQELLADSGDPRAADENTQIAVSVEIDGVEQTFNQGTTGFSEVSESTIVIEPGLFGSVDENVVTQVVAATPVAGEELLLESEIHDASGTITRTTIVTRQVQSEALPVVGTQFGFGFASGDVSETAVSNLTVRLPIFGENGRLLGTVELSQGPAYGRDILQNVFWGWLIASLVAVLLAGLAGWLASRRLVRPLLTLTQVTTQMADGDLAARTAVQRQDELGTLGRSFNKMADQVEGTITTLRQFIADAAHELHTPLTALQTDLQTLRQTELEPSQAAKIERAQEQAAYPTAFRVFEAHKTPVRQLAVFMRRPQQDRHQLMKGQPLKQLFQQAVREMEVTEQEDQAALGRQVVQAWQQAPAVAIRSLVAGQLLPERVKAGKLAQGRGIKPACRLFGPGNEAETVPVAVAGPGNTPAQGLQQCPAPEAAHGGTEVSQRHDIQAAALTHASYPELAERIPQAGMQVKVTHIRVIGEPVMRVKLQPGAGTQARMHSVQGIATAPGYPVQELCRWLHQGATRSRICCTSSGAICSRRCS